MYCVLLGYLGLAKCCQLIDKNEKCLQFINQIIVEYSMDLILAPLILILILILILNEVEVKNDEQTNNELNHNNELINLIIDFDFDWLKVHLYQTD